MGVRSRLHAEIKTELGGFANAASLRLARRRLATKGYSGAAASMAGLDLIGMSGVIGLLAQREMRLRASSAAAM